MSRHLMARMRRTAAPGHAFDWRQTAGADPEDYNLSYEVHQAPLENGHVLHAWADVAEFDGTGNVRNQNPTWDWAITDPANAASREYAKDWSPETGWDGPPPGHPQADEWGLPGDGRTPLYAGYLAAGGLDARFVPKYFKRWLPDHPAPVVVHGDAIHSLDEAKAQAEAAYKRLFPLGTDTGPHDSGVDYSDLNKFMGEL